MSAEILSGRRSFVLLSLGARRFALPAESVAELVGHDHLHTFPHTTPMLTGVLVRRGRIVPVWDPAPVLLGPQAPPRRFYLITRRQPGAEEDCVAIPVDGPCELAGGEPMPAGEDLPPYVSGLLALEGGNVEVLDLEKVAACSPGLAAGAADAEAQP